MRKYSLGNVLLFPLLITPSLLFADGKIGEAAFPTLEIGFGARSAAMGNAMCGLADDINTIWWNPGGLGQIKGGEASISYHTWFEGWKDTYGSVGYKTPMGMIALGLLYSDVTGMEGYNRFNQPVTEYKTYESILSLAYGKQVMKNLYFGISFMGMYINLDPATSGLLGDKGKAVASDIGIIWKKGKTKIGICGQNLGTTVSYYYKSSDYLPRNFKMGINISPKDKLNTSLEINIPQFGEKNFSIGSEYWLSDIIALRVGYRILDTQAESYSGVGDKLSAGFGIKYKSIGLDYAYAPYWVGMTHRMTLNWVIGEPAARVGGVIVKVIDAETRKPLQAIVTSVSGAYSDTVLTSPVNGEQFVKDLPIGKTIIRAQKDFFSTKEDTILISDYEVKKISLAISYIGPKGVPHERAVKGIFGKVTGSDTKLPVLATISYKGPKEGTIKTDTSGWYAISKIPPGNYTLTIEADSHNYFPQVIENVIVEKNEGTLTHSSLTKVKIMRLYFERDRAYVHPNDYPVLDTLATFMQRYKENNFEINGHTDPRPTAKFKNNMVLSLARADAIKEYLVSKGIGKDRIKTEGFGDKKPVASNDTEEGMAFNRRIEVIMNPPNQSSKEIQSPQEQEKKQSNTKKDNTPAKKKSSTKKK